MSTTLVIGANGVVGPEVVKLLKQQGRNVRRSTRRATVSADEVQLDLITGAGLQSAFQGVDRAFMLAPRGLGADVDKIFDPVIKEVKKQGVRKIVLMTGLGLGHDDNVPMRKVELLVERCGIAWNVIRPSWFLQNFNTGWLPGIQATGKIQLPIGQAKASFIDVRDIAAVAVKLLFSDEHNNQTFDLTGPEALGMTEVATQLTAVSGRQITFDDISPDAIRQALSSKGAPAYQIESLLELYHEYKDGVHALLNDSVLKITRNKPRSLRQYAKEFGHTWAV